VTGVVHAASAEAGASGQFTGLMDHVAQGFEALGAAILVAGVIWSVILAVMAARRSRSAARAYLVVRQAFGGTLLLGLEVLVAADLVRTVAVAPTLDNVLVLGLIVVIRTFLSFSLETEIEGVVPWRRALKSGAVMAVRARTAATAPEGDQNHGSLSMDEEAMHSSGQYGAGAEVPEDATVTLFTGRCSPARICEADVSRKRSRHIVRGDLRDRSGQQFAGAARRTRGHAQTNRNSAQPVFHPRAGNRAGPYRDPGRCGIGLACPSRRRSRLHRHWDRGDGHSRAAHPHSPGR
jgi:uncharacterized membrane protein